MIELKDTKGQILYRSDKRNYREALREAIKEGIDLSGLKVKDEYLMGIGLSKGKLKDARFESCNLTVSDFTKSNLEGAVFINCLLKGSSFSKANLKKSFFQLSSLETARFYRIEGTKMNFKYCSLNGSLFDESTLKYSNFKSNTLRGASFRFSDLTDADFPNATEADINGIDLTYIIGKDKIEGYLILPEGDIIGYKKVISKGKGDAIAKLLISSDARRFKSYSGICRCEKAKVLSITTLKGVSLKSAHSIYNSSDCPLWYKVGEIAIPDLFDPNPFKECSNGIHFFLTEKEAINY